MTVCAEADQQCPTFPGAARRARWPLDDPAIAGTDPDRVLAILRLVRDEAEERIRALLEAMENVQR